MNSATNRLLPTPAEPSMVNRKQRRSAAASSNASPSLDSSRRRPTKEPARSDDLTAAPTPPMPAFHSASISTKMLQELGGATVIGPLLVGLDRPVQIVPLGAKDATLVNMAALAAFNVSG